MRIPRTPPTVLLIYENAEAAAFIEKAAQGTTAMTDMTLVHGCDAALEYLDHCRPTVLEEQFPCPNLILFDLASTLESAETLLDRLKEEETFRPVPVIVLACQPVGPEYVDAYDRGVNAFVERPDSVEEMTRTLQIIEEFWIGVVQLPHAERS